MSNSTQISFDCEGSTMTRRFNTKSEAESYISYMGLEAHPTTNVELVVTDLLPSEARELALEAKRDVR